jgi:hypothetical protein
VRRLHLLEIEDQPWCPAVLRDAATAFLRFGLAMSGHARILSGQVAELMRQCGETHILDLCSGGGGPYPALLDGLAEDGIQGTATLTDRYPNLAAFRDVAAVSGGRVDYVEEPVDATAVPARLTGVRTLFNSFHHFRPEMARSILADAVRARRPIAVLEVVGREPFMLFAMLLSPLNVLLMMPFVRPRRLSWLFFTYVVPLVPLLVIFDGIVSCLRIYSQEELRELVADLGGDDWHWEVGRTRLGKAPAHATYLVGRPAKPDAAPAR